MRLTIALVLGAAGVALVWLWWAGAFAAIAGQAVQWQRHWQDGLAQGLTAVRAGHSGAVWAVLLACLGYGFAHAAGPGHGKAVIGGAALASRATAWRLSALAVLASLGQALTAIVLVYGGFLIFEFTSRQVNQAADTYLTPLSALLIGAIGLYLAVTGSRQVLARLAADDVGAGLHDHHDHPHDHDHGENCSHKHGPSMQEAAETKSVGSALALIAGIAIRPCTGAVLVLVICWQSGLLLLGVAAVLAMAAGTAAFTVMVAVLAVSARGASLTALGEGALARFGLPMARIGAGCIVMLAALAVWRAGG